MKSAGDVLKNTIHKLGLDSRIKSYQIWHIWDKAVGLHIAQVAQPEDIKGKTLFVKVRDSIWLRQLKFLEAMIIAKLNEAAGEKVVGSIYFKLGDIKVPSSKFQVPSNVILSEAKNLNMEHGTCDTEHTIDLSLIKDTTLKQTIQRIISKTAAAGRK